ncbi:hypothetical protein ACFV3R_19365 [Streptomyces sp. NPDC059740]|uniref:hypothetical protein n=1 Tax=Streptomyces sp. NPDC059740 TaxID=3346926 RepID=UPI003648D848
MGVIVGDWYEWHANGQLARHLEHNEKGHEVRRRKWAKDGTLLQDYDNSGTQSA